MNDVNVSLTALDDVYHALKEFQKNILDLPKELSDNINSLIFTCESEIDKVKSKLKQLEQEKYSLEISLQGVKKSIITCESQISSVECEVSAMRNALSNVLGSAPIENEKAKEIEYQISALECKLATIRNELILYWKECDEIGRDLNEKIKEIYCTKNRLMRMNSAFFDVQIHSEALKAKMNSFCCRASEDSGANASSIALCIDYLEEYMNTDL